MNTSDAMKKLGATAAITLSKTPDVVVGWRAAQSSEVQTAIQIYNERAVDEYKAKLLAELGF